MKRYIVLIGAILVGFALKAQSVTYTCRYWFNQEHEQAVTTTFSESIWQPEFNVDALLEGLHTLHLQVMDTSMKWSAPQSYLFLKTNAIQPEGCVYHCWFDQDYTTQQSNVFGNGQFLLDVADLEDGLHTVNIIIEGNSLTAAQSYTFLKVAVEDPTAGIQYRCWFDQDPNAMQTGSVSGGFFELDVSALSNGLHTVNVQFDGGQLTAPQRYMFYKIPFGGNGFNKWEYWVNGDWANRVTTNIFPAIDTLDIISLLQVPTQPIRSICFQFHPNGDTPELFAKNEITLRFWTADGHFLDRSAFYVDEYTSETIEADDLERNTTVSIAAPRDNNIKWYRLPLQFGDSVAFRTDKACTMQLFAPSGEEVYAAMAGEAMVFGGCHAFEDGDYYLAVHDVTGSGETVSLTYYYLHKYAVLAYDVHLVGNGGCSTITFQGNGFNSLLDVYLVNYQNDTIRRLDIGHESNTTTTVTFDFYQVNLGVYDAVFQFYGETIRVNGALEVQEPVDILLTSSVSYPSQFLRNTPCTYTYTITNNGNMSAYGVPIYVYISTPTENGISNLQFEGLDLASLFDYMNLDSLSPSAIAELRTWTDEWDDEDYFSIMPIVDEETGDSVFVRSGFFFFNLSPFETKTLKLVITADELLDVWITIPNETIQPISLNTLRGAYERFCCSFERKTCQVSIWAQRLNWLSFWTDAALFASLLGGQVLTGVSEVLGILSGLATIASCFTSATDATLSTLYIIACGNYDDGFLDFLRNLLKASTNLCKSGFGTLLSCIPMAEVFKKGTNVAKEVIRCLKEAWKKQRLDIAKDIATDIGALMVSQPECLKKNYVKRPDCPGDDHKGGSSEPVSSLDPNDIYGYLSESGSHYMRQEIQNVQYEIEFENDTTLASAAAHTIIVRDTLDASKFDLNSLAARSVTIGDKRLELNGEQTFARTLDLRPEIYVIAQIEQDYDPATGIVEWTIQSLDPMTMEPTDDPNQGVLPVNYYGNGVGFIDYSIDLKEAFADGTEISNRAGIIFDQEDIIMTPTWTNTVDAVKPTSHIEEVIPNADTLKFIFASEDNRSGVWYHTVYYRNAATEMEWKVKKAQIFENNYLLVNDELMTTEFLVMATDSAGNQEAKDMVAEYTFVYDGPGQITQTDALAQGWNWWSTYIEQGGQDGLVELENSLGHNGLTIKSQNDFTDNYYQDIGADYWYGSLESIQNEQGYLINVAQPCNTSLTGVAAVATSHPITILPNWNWIGYPVTSAQVVTTALAGFNPSPDDVLKGQSDFTSYYEGYGWYPDDFTLVPGQSYLYCSNASVNKILTYTNGNRGWMAPRKAKTLWEANTHAYVDNLNVIAVVNVDNVEQRDEALELGAFVNDECRGSVHLSYFAPMDRYLAMLTVTGQEDEQVEFRLVDTDHPETEETSLNRLVFKKNTVVGCLGKPYEVHFGECNVGTSNMSMYPNPVEKGHEFSLDIPHDETIIEIAITDVLGAQVRHETGAVNPKSVKGLPTAGVYVIKAVAKSGTTYHGRLIVE